LKRGKLFFFFLKNKNKKGKNNKNGKRYQIIFVTSKLENKKCEISPRRGDEMSL